MRIRFIIIDFWTIFMRIVIALGGNMIVEGKSTGTYQEQKAKLEKSAKVIVDLLKMGHDLILTHGNGPQVGNLLLQQASISTVPALPLRILGAMTQAQIGVMLELALKNELLNSKDANLSEKEVIVVPTSVLVNSDDPSFQDPTKPIGPFFDENQFTKIKIGEDEIYKTFNLGYRRVVPSPDPVDIIERQLIESLSKAGNLVIAVGGGGTPVVSKKGKLEPVDAVIDKDRASSLLAREIHADGLLILTNVDGVYKRFGSAEQKLISKLDRMIVDDLEKDGELQSGTIKPKVYACQTFVENGGKFAIITSPDKALKALTGKAGTIYGTPIEI